MRMTSQAAFLLAFAFASSGCNLVFDIQPGTLATSAGGTGGASTGGTGGAAATCPPTKPASCDPDATTSESCCVMGRSCGGGECVVGECAAETILPALDPSHGLDCVSMVVAGDYLFVTTGWNHGLVRTGLDGSGKVDVNVPDALGINAIARIAVDPEPSPESVYFNNYSGARIATVKVGGGVVTTLADVPVAGLEAHYGNVLVHGEFVYWAMQKEYTESPGRDIWRAKRTSHSASAEKVVEAASPLALAGDADYLYVADNVTNTIGRVPWSALGEGASLPVTAETLVTDAATDPVNLGIGEMAVDDEYLYWGSESTLWVVPKSTPLAEREAIGTGNSALGIILADGRDVYFATLGGTSSPSQVIRVAKGGVTKTQRTMLEAPLRPDDEPVQISSLAQDCGHVYALLRQDCELRRFTK